MCSWCCSRLFWYCFCCCCAQILNYIESAVFLLLDLLSLFDAPRLKQIWHWHWLMLFPRTRFCCCCCLYDDNVSVAIVCWMLSAYWTACRNGAETLRRRFSRLLRHAWPIAVFDTDEVTIYLIVTLSAAHTLFRPSPCPPLFLMLIGTQVYSWWCGIRSAASNRN